MENRIEKLEPTTILGKSLEMSLAQDKTQALWQSFGPFVKDIENRKDRNFISLQKFNSVFDPKNFDPNAPFTKWAGVALQPAIEDGNAGQRHDGLIPGLSLYEIQGGMYAVFTHVGPASEFRRSMEYVFGEWFPKSAYLVDDREHFEVLPEGYRPDDPNAQEEIWIPIRKK